jgi:hypothetical protein
MGGKAKSRCHLGKLKVNNLRHRYLSIMKLENCSPTGECLNNNLQTSLKLYFLLFRNNNFSDTEGTKMADPILEPSLKTTLKTFFTAK